jgi:predicted nucleic-acid-binding Zn-ribbon protein
MEHKNYECLRCKCREYEVGEMHVAGSVLAKVFDVEGNRFSSVTCANCKHTEFFKVERSGLDNIFDLFVT